VSVGIGDRFEGKVALVTGAASGIGRACARRLAEEGARVCLADLDGTAAEMAALELSKRSDARSVAAQIDVTHDDSMRLLFDRIAQEFGRLDVAVNSAGIGAAPAPTADVATHDWDTVIAVNLTGVFRSMRGELRLMRSCGGGSIVNIASVMAAAASDVGASAYVASKHGVVGLTRAAALEHAKDNIRVNAVGPGYIRTPLAERALDEAGLAARIALHPLGRLGTVDEVADLVCWLASEGASFATGSFYPIDGGYLAR
jgi:NAD(P)-dependent dehydrogenase (short-subunit alcohol dehydrogenase family)